MTQFPRKAWVLQPSFRPKQVTLVEIPDSLKEFAETDTGKWYRLTETYATKAEAIAGGWMRIGEQQTALDKKSTNLDKKRAALAKATHDK